MENDFLNPWASIINIYNNNGKMWRCQIKRNKFSATNEFSTVKFWPPTDDTVMYGFLTEEIVRGFHLVFLFGTTTSRIVFGRRENLIFAATNESIIEHVGLPQRESDPT
jgi:hypothetical protein